MRNLRQVRKLRCQTPAAQRRHIRKLNAEITRLDFVAAELQKEVWALQRENTRLRERPQKLDLPKDFTDRLADQFCLRLAEAITDKVVRDHPDFSRYSRMVGVKLAQVFRDDASFFRNMHGPDPEYIVREIVETSQPYLKFTMNLGGADLHFMQDRREYELRRTFRATFDPNDEVMRVPQRMALTNDDVNRLVLPEEHRFR